MKMTANNKKSNVLAKFGVLLMVVMVLLSALISPMKVSAHSSYLLTVTLNENANRYEPMILYDREGFLQTHSAHREAELGYYGKYNYSKHPLPDMSSGTAATVTKALDKIDGKFVNPDLGTGVGDPFFIYSFPGYHGKNDYDATGKDLARAEWVSTNVVQSLNDAIAFVTTESGQKPHKYGLMYLATKLANAGYHTGSSSFKWGSSTVKVEAQAKNVKSTEKVKGVNSDGYARVTVKTGSESKSRIFVSKVPKGYKNKDQAMYNSIPHALHADMAKGKNFGEDTLTLTWKHMVLQAHYSYNEKGISYDAFETISKPNKVEEFLTEMGENTLLGLRTILGLHSFSELMLNEGTRGGDSYFLGIMPMSWLDSAEILHWTSMALSWMLLMFAFVKILALRNLAAINVAKRVDMVEGIKSMIIVGFALMLFNPMFYALANFNYLLVDVMKNTSNVTSSFGSSAPGGGLISKLLINFAYLVIEVYFNFIYISRGIIVAILYGVGPLFVTSLAYGGKYTQMFSNYMKELVGTIYMQTFHAILVAFFATVTVFGGVRLFEQLVVLFAFIPLTKFFREAIGVGGGIADFAGAGAFGAVGDMAKAGTKGMRQKAYNSKNASSSKDGGGNAPTTQMKSASNFQGGGGSGGNGSMGDVDSKPMFNIGKNGGYTDDAGNAVTSRQIRKSSGSNGVGGSGGNATANSMADVGGGALAGSSVGSSLMKASLKGGLNATAGLSGAGGAIGMSAVGAGGVGQNMKEVTPTKPKSFGSTKNGMKDVQKKNNQKAPNEVFGNKGYAGSEIDDSHNMVQHKFRVNEEDGSNAMYDEYGITDVREEDNSIVYEYDYDTDSNSFNSGDYNAGEKALTMQDMEKVFNSDNLTTEQEARKAHYENQGIKSVTKNANGRVEIKAAKGTGGVYGAGSESGMYRFRKRNGDNGSVNLLDSIEYAQNQ